MKIFQIKKKSTKLRHIYNKKHNLENKLIMVPKYLPAGFMVLDVVLTGITREMPQIAVGYKLNFQAVLDLTERRIVISET